jgi:hypothetical protein
VFPIIIFAAVAIPLLTIAFFTSRRSTRAGEHPVGETDADRRRVEQEFEDAERYETEWREEQHKHPHDPPL